MEAFLGLFLFTIVIGLYVAFCAIVANALKMKNGRNAFWWIFFLGLIGAVIALLIDIRDGNLVGPAGPMGPSGLSGNEEIQ